MLDSIAPELVGMVLAETEQRSINLSKWACQHDDAYSKAMEKMEERFKSLEEKISRMAERHKTFRDKVDVFLTYVDKRLQEIDEQEQQTVDEDRLAQVENDVYELQISEAANLSGISQVKRLIQELRDDINSNSNAANYNANMLRKINANLNFLND